MVRPSNTTPPWTSASPILDIHHPDIQRLVKARGWRALDPYARIGAVYHFVRDELAFGYNASDDLPASRVLADGLGQCNTKGTLLMALLRAVGIPCRFHSFIRHWMNRNVDHIRSGRVRPAKRHVSPPGQAGKHLGANL